VFQVVLHYLLVVVETWTSISVYDAFRLSKIFLLERPLFLDLIGEVGIHAESGLFFDIFVSYSDFVVDADFFEVVLELQCTQPHQLFLTLLMPLHSNIHRRMIILINQRPILINISILLLYRSPDLTMVFIVTSSIVHFTNICLDRRYWSGLICLFYQ